MDKKAFADKWLRFFEEPPLNADNLFEAEMGRDCLDAGFSVDGGRAFASLYLKNGEYFSNTDDFQSALINVTDVSALGNAIYSKWTGVTKWNGSPLTKDNETWFILALYKLQKLT